jgi:hypothetical protein
MTQNKKNYASPDAYKPIEIRFYVIHKKSLTPTYDINRVEQVNTHYIEKLNTSVSTFQQIN